MTTRRRSSALPAGPRLPPSGQTLRLWHDPVGFQQRALQRYGEPFTLRLHPIGDLVVVSDPETVLQVFRGAPETFRAGTANGRILPILECQSLLLSDGERHRHRRRLLMPAFRGPRVAELDETIRAEAHTAMAGWSVGQPFPLLPSLRALTLWVILQAVIAVPNAAARAELAASVTHLLAPAAAAALWWGRGRRAWWSPLGVFERRRAAVHGLVRQEVGRRRRAAEPLAGDVLDTLMGATGEDGRRLDAEAICDEVVTLMIAGHETTSTALAWTFERVLRHPAVLERARAAARGGARRCIGADLAMFEMKTVLATVLAEADLSAERVAPEHTRLLGTALRPSRRATVVSAHPVS